MSVLVLFFLLCLRRRIQRFGESSTHYSMVYQRASNILSIRRIKIHRKASVNIFVYNRDVCYDIFGVVTIRNRANLEIFLLFNYLTLSVFYFQFLQLGNLIKSNRMSARTWFYSIV